MFTGTYLNGSISHNRKFGRIGSCGKKLLKGPALQE
jgi:hypothetical protein